MSMHRPLKSKQRKKGKTVLKRIERIKKLIKKGKLKPEDNPLGLPNSNFLELLQLILLIYLFVYFLKLR